MRLLNKNEVASLKSKEKGVEIQEGLKLAKKIDVLRETAAEEETRLAKFRDNSLALLREEMNDLILKRDILKQEVDELDRERIRLQLAIESVKTYK